MGQLIFEDYRTRHLTVLLFKDVANAKEIRASIISGQLKPECSIINATLVPDLLVVQVAALKALQAQQRGQLRTRSLHAEVVFDISGSRHIAESLTRYGINADSRHLLVARFDATDEDLERIRATVQGSEAPLAELPGLTNTELLSKYYKVVGPELKVGSLGDAALVRIAARDC